MMALWLRCLRILPATVASPMWYLGLLFGLLWAGRIGWGISPWLALGGGVLILLSLYGAGPGRSETRTGLTISDIIRA